MDDLVSSFANGFSFLQERNKQLEVNRERVTSLILKEQETYTLLSNELIQLNKVDYDKYLKEIARLQGLINRKLEELRHTDEVTQELKELYAVNLAQHGLASFSDEKVYKELYAKNYTVQLPVDYLKLLDEVSQTKSKIDNLVKSDTSNELMKKIKGLKTDIEIKKKTLKKS